MNSVCNNTLTHIKTICQSLFFTFTINFIKVIKNSEKLPNSLFSWVHEVGRTFRANSCTILKRKNFESPVKTKAFCCSSPVFPLSTDSVLVVPFCHKLLYFYTALLYLFPGMFCFILACANSLLSSTVFFNLFQFPFSLFLFL